MGCSGIGAVGYQSLVLVVCCEHFVTSDENPYGLVHWKGHRGWAGVGSSWAQHGKCQCTWASELCAHRALATPWIENIQHSLDLLPSCWPHEMLLSLPCVAFPVTSCSLSTWHIFLWRRMVNSHLPLSCDCHHSWARGQASVWQQERAFVMSCDFYA